MQNLSGGVDRRTRLHQQGASSVVTIPVCIFCEVFTFYVIEHPLRGLSRSNLTRSQNVVVLSSASRVAMRCEFENNHRNNV